MNEKYKAFKKFDTIDDHSDYYYSKPELRKVQIVKKVRVFVCPCRHPEDRVSRIQALSQDKKQGVHPQE
jgi:hypothetical protein